MSLLSRLNPANLIPRFPPYPGPYAVGSFEVEIPVKSLAPPGTVDGVPETVQFRIFYPTQKPAENPAGGWWGQGDKKQEDPSTAIPKPVRWLPEPHQREYLSAYARFLGASSGFAEIVSLLNYISLPVAADAPLLPSPSPSPFPTMIFSHGLGGTRLAYSHICGSIASHGVVVVAPEHRDGSAPVSFVRTGAAGAQETQIPGTKPSSGEPGIDEASAAASSAPEGDGSGRIQVDYAAYTHHVSEETANGRNRQLEIRLREIALVYSALASLDAGRIPAGAIVSTDEIPNGATGAALLSTLKARLDIREPGRVIWAGHSFGAATMFQFTKTIHRMSLRESSTTTYKPLLTPECISADPTTTTTTLPLQQQVTPDSPLLLLDLWCLPLLGQRTNYLFKQPLPQIGAGNPRSVLVVMSDEFWRWKENLHGVRRALSADPGRRRGGDANHWFEQWDDDGDDGGHKHEQVSTPAVGTAVGPRFYYVHKSAHLSQSDFGILFPRAIRGADGPQRILDLNVRAVVQWLREAGVTLGGVEEEVGGGIFGGEVDGWSRIALEGEEEIEVGKTGKTEV